MQITIKVTTVTSDPISPASMMKELTDMLNEMKDAELNRYSANLSGENIDVSIKVED